MNHVRGRSSVALLVLLMGTFAAASEEQREDFLMPIEDVFFIEGRGLVVTGRVVRGSLIPGDEVDIVGLNPTQKLKVKAVETFRGSLPKADKGANVGLLLQGLTRQDMNAGAVERGQVAAKPGTASAHAKLSAEVLILREEEGGDPAKFRPNARLQFWFRTVDITGVRAPNAGVYPPRPGEKTEMTIDLLQPVALEKNLEFMIRSAGKTLGIGRVTNVQ